EGEDRCRLHLVAALEQVDAQAGVRADRVGADEVVNAAVDAHTVDPIEGDRIGRSGSAATDGVAAGGDELDAVADVAQVGGAAGVGADEFPLDDIAVCAGRTALQGDAVLPEDIPPRAVGRDQVAGPGGGPADRVERRALDVDAAIAVAQAD